MSSRATDPTAPHGGRRRRSGRRRSAPVRGGVAAVLGAVAVLVSAACQPAPPPPPPPTTTTTVTTPPAPPPPDSLDAVPVSASTNPADSTPWVLDGKVWAIAKVGNRIVVGGDFTKVQNAGGGTTYARSNLFAFDPVTGAVDPAFAPQLDGKVESVAPSPDGRSVVVGGDFKRWGTTVTGGLVRLQLASGAPAPGFAAVTDGWVFSVKVQGSRIYLGGSFAKVNGQVRPGLAAVDLTTGAVDPNLTIGVSETIASSGTGGNPLPYVYRLAVSPDGHKLVVLGNFRKVAGASRPQLAVIDVPATGPATLSSWQSNVPGTNLSYFYLRDLAISPDGTYFVNTAWWSPGSPLMDAATRWDLQATGPGQQPQWIDATGGDSLFSVGITDRTVYVGGHPRWLNNGNTPSLNTAGPAAVARPQVAALDPVNGVPYTWAPGQQRGFGATAILTTADGVYYGSDVDYIGGEYHPRLSFFPYAGGKLSKPAHPVGLPATLYSARGDGTLHRLGYDGATFGADQSAPTGGVAWAQARGAFMIRGSLYTVRSDGSLDVRRFDGSTYGPAATVPIWQRLTGASGAFFDQGRLYYTVAGDPHLYYRYFEPESGILGYDQFVASGGGDGFDWRSVTGLALVDGRLYFGQGDGRLRQVPFAGRPFGSVTVVSTTTGAGQLWSTPGFFAYAP